jgi:hypothetical protein
MFDDKLNLRSGRLLGIKAAFEWIHDISGWHDPVYGSIGDMDSWVTISVNANSHGIVSLKPSEITDPVGDASKIDGASKALNANFYIGGETGSRFNWMGGW